MLNSRPVEMAGLIVLRDMLDVCIVLSTVPIDLATVQ